MNPLLKGAEQIRYQSPLYETVYDDEDNAIDDECVRSGTDVINTFIRPVHYDGKPRYYRLRYPVHAKEHKHRWERWLKDQLVDAHPYCVKVSKVGRRVLFSVDPNFVIKKQKALRRLEAHRRRASKIDAELQLAAAEEPFAWEDMGLDLELERERQERNDYE
jgi:hypothetical protein